MLMIITTVITTFADIALTFQEIESQAASVQQSSNRGLTESLSRCPMFLMMLTMIKIMMMMTMITMMIMMTMMIV